MPRRPAARPAAHREQIIALARAGRSLKELIKRCELSEQPIWNWIVKAQAGCNERPEVLMSDERAEPQRLRCENRQRKVERDILGKPRPDSRGRREQSRPSLRVRERDSGCCAGGDEVPRVRRVGARRRCVAAARSVGPRHV